MAKTCGSGGGGFLFYSRRGATREAQPLRRGAGEDWDSPRKIWDSLSVSLFGFYFHSLNLFPLRPSVAALDAVLGWVFPCGLVLVFALWSYFAF